MTIKEIPDGGFEFACNGIRFDPTEGKVTFLYNGGAIISMTVPDYIQGMNMEVLLEATIRLKTNV